MMSEVMALACVKQVAGHESIIDGWQFKPLAGHARWPQSALNRLAQERARVAFNDPSNSFWLSRAGDEVNGSVVLLPLPWDSQQLGMSAGRLDYFIAEGSYAQQLAVKNTLLNKALDAARVRGIKHLSVRVDARDQSSLHALEEHGFVTVDSLLTFARDLKEHPPVILPTSFRLRLAGPADAPQAAMLARSAYRHDRFHVDPEIADKRADELHAAWLSNSCTGRAADAVVLAEDERGLLGYVTCKVQRDTKETLGRAVGTIVLVATAAHARGAGVGRAATMRALSWFQQQEVSIVEVGTQLRNLAASRLYQKCGFGLVGSSITLRKILREQ